MSICDHHSPFGCNTMRGKAGAIINDSDQGGWNGQIAHHSISNGKLGKGAYTGIAASLIRGKMLHVLFGLTIN